MNQFPRKFSPTQGSEVPRGLRAALPESPHQYPKTYPGGLWQDWSLC